MLTINNRYSETYALTPVEDLNDKQNDAWFKTKKIMFENRILVNNREVLFSSKPRYHQWPQS